MREKLKTIIFITVLSLSAASLANILINPLVEDLFASCLSPSQTGEVTLACEYGTQSVYAGLAGLFLMIFSVQYGFKRNNTFHSRLGALSVGPLYLISRIVVWRLYLRLPDRSPLGFGEDKDFGNYFRDYVDVGFLVTAGLVAGIFYLALKRIDTLQSRKLPVLFVLTLLSGAAVYYPDVRALVIAVGLIVAYLAATAHMEPDSIKSASSNKKTESETITLESLKETSNKPTTKKKSPAKKTTTKKKSTAKKSTASKKKS